MTTKEIINQIINAKQSIAEIDSYCASLSSDTNLTSIVLHSTLSSKHIKPRLHQIDRTLISLEEMVTAYERETEIKISLQHDMDKINRIISGDEIED